MTRVTGRLINTAGDVVVTEAVDGTPRAYVVTADGAFEELTQASAVALHSARSVVDADPGAAT